MTGQTKGTKNLIKNWQELLNYCGSIVANNTDCENNCYAKFTEIINKIKKHDSKFELEKNQLTDKCTENEKKIEYLKRKLKNANVPMFDVGQEIYQTVRDKDNGGYKIDKVNITYVVGNDGVFEFHTNYQGQSPIFAYTENELFATKEEALRKLKEITGE